MKFRGRCRSVLVVVPSKEPCSGEMYFTIFTLHHEGVPQARTTRNRTPVTVSLFTIFMLCPIGRVHPTYWQSSYSYRSGCGKLEEYQGDRCP